MAAEGLHISISAEPIAYIGDFAVTNSIFTSLVVSTLLIGFAVLVNSRLTDTDHPTGLQNFAEWIIESFHKFIYSVTGDLKRTRLFLPLVTSFFLFILLNNWLGLVPGVGPITVPHPPEPEASAPSSQVYAASDPSNVVEEAVGEGQPEWQGTTAETEHAPEAKHQTAVPLFRPGSADLNTTIALAIISVLATQVFGYHFQGLAYFKKYFDFSGPIAFFVGILELVLEFAKIVSFAFRLFGNIFAGEVLLVVIASLLPIIAPMPFYGLELFVGFVQALVFAVLTLVFFNMAAQGHDAEH